MGQLQHELDTETDVMIGMVRHQFEPGTESYIRETHGKFQDSDAYDMLVRTRERIINGEEWDVAEICHVIYDTDEISKVGVEWEITDDETVPTIGDILKGRGRSVMDSESAIVSAAELEKNIADLAKQREKLVSTITKVGANPQSGGYDKRFFDMVRGLGEHLGSFLGSLSRDGTQITFGDSKDIYGNYTEGNGRDFGLEVIEVSEPNSAEFLDLEQKSVEDAVLWTTVADSQLRSRLSNGRGDNLEDRK
jgi:hypothetical protein